MQAQMSQHSNLWMAQSHHLIITPQMQIITFVSRRRYFCIHIPTESIENSDWKAETDNMKCSVCLLTPFYKLIVKRMVLFLRRVSQTNLHVDE